MGKKKIPSPIYLKEPKNNKKKKEGLIAPLLHFLDQVFF